MPVIRECNTRSDKNIILDCYTIPYIHTRLDRDAITYDDIIFD